NARSNCRRGKCNRCGGSRRPRSFARIRAGCRSVVGIYAHRAWGHACESGGRTDPQIRADEFDEEVAIQTKISVTLIIWENVNIETDGASNHLMRRVAPRWFREDDEYEKSRLDFSCGFVLFLGAFGVRADGSARPRSPPIRTQGF